MKTTLVILASVLLAVAMIGAVYALDNAVVTATVSVPGTISVTAATGLTFGSVERGLSAEDTLDITVDSNKAYSVKSSAVESYFEKNTVADTTIPRENLEWYTGSAWTDYSSVATEIAVGAAGTQIHNVNHKLTVPATAEPATYTLDVTVLAVQN